MSQHRSKLADPVFARALSAFRREAGKTQEQTAEALGVDVATIANWEHARSEPKASQIVRLALFFGIAAGDLFRFQTGAPLYEARDASQILPDIRSMIEDLAPESGVHPRG